MTHLDYFVFAPAVVALIVMAALLHEYRRPRPRTDAEKRAVALLLSWLTPEQEKHGKLVVTSRLSAVTRAGVTASPTGQ
jgi:hypothetical protein